MQKLKLIAGALVMAAGAPAAAQIPSTNYYNGGDYQYRIDQLDQRLESGIQSGRLTRYEAYSLRQELRSLRQLERQYRSSGFSGYERAELDRRIASIRERVRIDLRDTDYRDQRYDDWVGDYDSDDRDREDFDRGEYERDDYDRDDGDRDDYEPDDYDNDPRDDRGYDRRGDWDAPDRWEEDCPPGLERRNNACLPPGQERRWSDDDQTASGYYAVPDRYRYQYRDTDRHYYRYRDGYIFQIDRRTHRALNTIHVGR